jgi:hypothetical protein
MDVYTEAGNIVRQFPNQDGTTEVELEFLDLNVFWSRLVAMTTFYVAFHDVLSVDYAVTSSTQRRAVVHQRDFDERAQNELIRTLLEVKDNTNQLLGLADKHLFDKPDARVVTTTTDALLRAYETDPPVGAEFLEAVASALAEDRQDDCS